MWIYKLVKGFERGKKMACIGITVFAVAMKKNLYLKS